MYFCVILLCDVDVGMLTRTMCRFYVTDVLCKYVTFKLDEFVDPIIFWDKVKIISLMDLFLNMLTGIYSL